MPFRALVAAPATLRSSAKPLNLPPPVLAVCMPKDKLHAVYAGRTDPSDPSAFTLRIDAGDEKLVIRGRLTDADEVEWAVDEGAAQIDPDANIQPF